MCTFEHLCNFKSSRCLNAIFIYLFIYLSVFILFFSLDFLIFLFACLFFHFLWTQCFLTDIQNCFSSIAATCPYASVQTNCSVKCRQHVCPEISNECQPNNFTDPEGEEFCCECSQETQFNGSHCVLKCDCIQNNCYTTTIGKAIGTLSVDIMWGKTTNLQKCSG